MDMRKLVITFLMATAAAAPAYAQRAHAWGSDDNSQTQRNEAREERQQARENREKANDDSATTRGEAIAARRQAMESHREAASETGAVAQASGNLFQDRARAHSEARAVRADVEAIREARAEALQAAGSGHQWQSTELQQRNRELRQNRAGGSDRNWRQSDRAVPHVLRDRAPIVSSTPREGTQPPLRSASRDRTTHHWSTQWRHNDRYDWQNWRSRHRTLFRLGFYNDPFGWNYQSYNIGWRMWPSYYSSRYWISDPWQYRLPYAPPGYRWVRYWDDAILVDTWSGEVVDVIRNFFW